MNIFVLRHGQAEAQQTTDEARNLTAKGCADVVLSATSVLPELQQVQEIWVSPLVRAQQTAQLVRDCLAQQGVNIALRTTEFIIPEAKPIKLLDALAATNLASVLLVSHMPFVGDLLDVLCGSARGYHALNTSSMALVQCTIPAANCGELRWLKHVNA